MVILEWFPLLSESVLQLVPPRSANSELLLAYLILSVLTKRAAYLAAFFMSCMLFEAEMFDALSEADLYLLTFAMYSYVIFDIACNRKAVIACGILLALSIILAYDAYHYGIEGIYGAHETVVYNNIEHLALYAHIIFISTLTPFGRIGDSIGRFVAFIVRVKSDSACIVVC